MALKVANHTKGSKMLEEFAQIVKEHGGEMEFDEFIAECRARGLRAEMWLRAKHDGLIATSIEAGRHIVRLPNEQEG